MTGGVAVRLSGVSKRFGATLAVEGIDLAVREGEFFTLLGASGCGKTTTLRLIAGFDLPSAGRVEIGGQDVTEAPAYRRPVHTVFQSYALFPHLSVAENVAFPLRLARVRAADRRLRVAAALDLVQMGGFADRRPSQLSGGQQQRVALARALVNEPRVLLLDEPLGALDLKLRKEMQAELKHMQKRLGITFVFVTHDQEEALAMSDRIALMHAGRIVQVDAPEALYNAPVSRYAAEFIGETNLLPATVAAAGAGHVVVAAAGQTLALPWSGPAPEAGQAATLAVRPECVLRGDEAAAAADEGLALEGRLEDVTFIGSDLRLTYDCGPAGPVVVRVQNRAGPGPEPGERLRLVLPRAALRLLAS